MTAWSEERRVPGTQAVVRIVRGGDGRLLRLECGGRVYAERRDGRLVLDDVADVREAPLPRGLVRHVRAAGRSWTEEYAWDEAGRPVRVDGVRVERDAHGRVTACDGWRYAYDGDALAAVHGPNGARAIARGRNGEPTAVREGDLVAEITYDRAGRRADTPTRPEGWHRDELGRLWTVAGPRGEIAATFLWDGFRCLGRIDGAPGVPLAAAFSLDPSGTPVRVVTRTGVARIPRDAFGEALLDHPGVPGLFGGAVHAGRVHYRGRALDPRTGSYTAPDPFHGDAGDPRRSRGYRGALPVDDSSGPYAVCRHDPVARVDPTGEISIPLVLSSLTWSSQYNLANFLFLDLFANFLLSLFQGKLDRWADREVISSDRSGAFGFRLDPTGIEPFTKLFAGSARRFTLHHVFWCPSDDEAWGGVEPIRVFVPGEAFRPSLYGTLLRAEPERGAPFLLRGSSPADPSGVQIPVGAEGWTRAGGTAESVVPGSTVPVFPRGGIHFRPRGTIDWVEQKVEPGGILGKQPGRMAELRPVGTLVQGRIRDDRQALVPKTGLGLAPGRLVMLADPAGKIDVVEVQGVVERDGKTTLGLTPEPSAVSGTQPLRLRGLGPRSSQEPLSASGGDRGRLDARAAGSSVRYAAGDALRCGQVGNPVGSARVASLEAELTLDAALPSTFRSPLRLYRAEPGGPRREVTKTAADVLEFPEGQDPPDVDDAVVVSGGGAATAVKVVEETGPRARRVDRPLAAALTGALEWQALARGQELGIRREPVAADSTLGFAPSLSGLAPAAGHVLVEDSADGTAARDVTALGADDLVLSAPLNGAASIVYDVERFPYTDLDEPDVRLETEKRLVLAAAGAVPGVALEVHQLDGTAPAAGLEVIRGAALAGNTATITFPAAVGVFPRGASAATHAPAPSQLVVLDDGTAKRVALVRRVRLTVGIDRVLELTGTPLECVRLQQEGFEYAAEQWGPLQVTVLPRARIAPRREAAVHMPRFRTGELVETRWTGTAPGTRRYRIDRVEGTTLLLAGDAPLPGSTPELTVRRLAPADPGTGGSRVGVDGTVVSATPGDVTVRLDVWQPSALDGGRLVAFTDGTGTQPAEVLNLRTLEVELFPPAPGLGASVTIGVPKLAVGTDPAYVASFTQQGSELSLPGLTLPEGNDLVVAVPFAPGPLAAAGEFNPGTVLVPEDPEHWELTRLQSLIDHELTHTLQSALWGPALLSPLPIALLEELFGLWPDWLRDILRIDSIGGLMNLIEGSTVSGLVWFFFKLYFFFERLFTGQPLSLGWLTHLDWLTFFPATVPDASRPREVQVSPSDGDTLELAANDLVELTSGTSFRRSKVVAASNGRFTLADDPPGGELQIARVGPDDPTFQVDTWVMANTGLGGLRWAFDPYAELRFRTDPESGSFLDILAGAAHGLFGSASWSGFPFGYFFWENGLKNKRGDGHLSTMEQRASEESGELYSALGRLRGELEYAGDVARYWYFAEDRHADVIDLGPGGSGLLDGPGVHVEDVPRVLPAFRASPVALVGDPNEDREAADDADAPGLQVPDLFFEKDPSRPHAAPASFPRSLAPALHGRVPTSGALERCCGVYVAFTRGGTHLVSTRNGVDGGAKALEAQKEDVQKLFFEKRVEDVQVTLGGSAVPAVADPTRPLPRIELVQTQRVTIEVSPNGHRRYAATLPQPTGSAVVRADGELALVAQKTNGIEPVEVSRVYRYDRVRRRFDDEALAAHGLHLPDDVHVPVRLFEVEVVDTIALRSGPRPDADAVSTARPGDTVYALVPAAVARPIHVRSVRYPGGAPTVARDPAPAVTVHTPSAAVQAFLGDGLAFRVRFPADQPPEEEAELDLVVGVGDPDDPTFLRALVTLEPHFLLENVGGGAFSVARGGTITLRCTHAVTPGSVAVSVPADVTAEISGFDVRLTVAAGAATGPRTVLVADAADPQHKARRTVEIT